jgi:hypothetical protein
MRGLDPRIHSSARAGGGMDRRVEPGDDNGEVDGARPSVKIPEEISRAGREPTRRANAAPVSLS